MRVSETPAIEHNAMYFSQSMINQSCSSELEETINVNERESSLDNGATETEPADSKQ